MIKILSAEKKPIANFNHVPAVAVDVAVTERQAKTHLVGKRQSMVPLGLDHFPIQGKKRQAKNPLGWNIGSVEEVNPIGPGIHLSSFYHVLW